MTLNVDYELLSEVLEEIASAIDSGDSAVVKDRAAELGMRGRYQPSAYQVRELREQSGLGMQACKRALVLAFGDQDEALAILKRGVQA